MIALEQRQSGRTAEHQLLLVMPLLRSRKVSVVTSYSLARMPYGLGVWPVAVNQMRSIMMNLLYCARAILCQGAQAGRAQVMCTQAQQLSAHRQSASSSPPGQCHPVLGQSGTMGGSQSRMAQASALPCS